MIPEMAAEIRTLCESIAFASPASVNYAIQTWYERIKRDRGVEDANIAFDIVQISRARGQTVNNIFQDGAMKNEMNIAGNATAVSQGQGNLIEVGDISNFTSYVEKSSLPHELQNGLIEGRRAIEGLSLSPEVVSEVLANYGKLTVEIQRATPNKGLVSLLWGGIVAVASAAKPIADLGKLLLPYLT